MKKLTPVLVVERVEPSIAFWTDRLGLQRTIEVPEGDHLGFAAVAGDGIEVMYQTRSSVAEDVEAVAELPFGGPTHLFVQVEDFEAVERAMEGAEVLVPRRTTFYGSTEIWVREPGGHFVGFAYFPPEAEGGGS